MTTAEAAADSYRQMAERLEEEAHTALKEFGPVIADDIALKAALCYRAAKAEDADARAHA